MEGFGVIDFRRLTDLKDTFAVLSRLIDYPDTETFSPEIRQLLLTDNVLSTATRGELLSLFDELAAPSLIEDQKIKAVKASPLNGKTPALHTGYWLAEEAPDERKRKEQEEDLKFHMSPAIRTDYYLNHLDVYGAEERWVALLNRYFLEQGEGEQEPVSLNERSFQIWGREKFLQREQGKKVLAHCGISLEQLCVYATSEPLAYYSACRQAPQTVLMI